MLRYCTLNLLRFKLNTRGLASNAIFGNTYALHGKERDVLSGKTTRIACASGFWGDSPSAGLIFTIIIVAVIR